MNFVARYLARRRLRDQIDAAWRPSYEALAYYNRDRNRGVCVEPYHAEFMTQLQREYDTEYLPMVNSLRRQLQAVK